MAHRVTALVGDALAFDPSPDRLASPQTPHGTGPDRTERDEQAQSGTETRAEAQNGAQGRENRYRSRPTECAAVQWHSGGDAPLTERCAREIASWVNANGGEARYVPLGEDTPTGWSGWPRIAVRTINGWAHAAPGHYVVMGEARFEVPALDGEHDERRDFYPCDPETFERRWEPAP